MEIKCPITDEVILRINQQGLVQRVNYSEVFFVLSDHSKMRILISKNAKKNLKKSQTNELFKNIQKERIIKLKGKPLDEKKKKKHLDRLKKLSYSEVVDRAKSLIKNK